ncbi:MAG: DNA adenine methylase [Anaerolineae bacterium]|nr:DNA adenine methylase [Anaerolineae bacterium]
MQTAKRGFFDVPPLRYLGAKWMLADWIISNFPPHDVYVEPFAGSGAVFFRKHPSRIEVLNDRDDQLVNFFQVLRDRPDPLIKAIELTPYALKEYKQAFEPSDDPIESARRLYIRCWQAYSSDLRYASGWRTQRNIKRGSNLAAEWSRLDGLTDAISRLKNAQIECRDAVEVIQYYDGPNVLFYVDPPYVHRSRAGKGRLRYRHEYTNEQHIQLAETLKTAKGMVLLSGYDCDLYRELYSGWPVRTKETTTNGNGKATEYLWVNPSAAASALPLFNFEVQT